jgi:hypothetical protein
VKQEAYDLMTSILRLFARIGFIFLLVNFYRGYKVLASPLFKHESKFFIRVFFGAVIVGFLLMLTEFFTDNSLLPLATVAFNTITTYVLVFYLDGRVDELNKQKDSAEYHKYTEAMDNFIMRLKKPYKK